MFNRNTMPIDTQKARERARDAVYHTMGEGLMSDHTEAVERVMAVVGDCDSGCENHVGDCRNEKHHERSECPHIIRVLTAEITAAEQRGLQAEQERSERYRVALEETRKAYHLTHNAGGRIADCSVLVCQRASSALEGDAETPLQST